MNGQAAILAWLRANPLTGRLLVRLAVVLPLGIATGLALAWLCDVLDVSQNFAALGAAVVAFGAGMRLAGRIADRLGIPVPEA
jgi:hypothetical protein